MIHFVREDQEHYLFGLFILCHLSLIVTYYCMEVLSVIGRSPGSAVPWDSPARFGAVQIMNIKHVIQHIHYIHMTVRL